MTFATKTPAAKSGAAMMIGESEHLQRARRLLQRYAGCSAAVLIEGETGTGKELAAREIHYASARALGPFVPVNCGALPESLLESELFGHRRGAFTDARSSEPGLVEYAGGGSLFLDEIDSLSPRAQTTLLRFLQNGEFRAVGERPLRKADVRIIAATNVSLAAAVEAGQFRRDLFYRLNPLYVNLPPLRHRDDDLMLLARHLLDEATARLGLAARHWSAQALQALRGHHWPGNVRELENLILRLCMRSDATTIQLADLAAAEPLIWGSAASTVAATSPTATAAVHVATPAGGAALPAAAGCPTRFAAAKRRAIEHFERDYLTALMRRADGNVSRAALLSGTERRQLGKLLKRHGIERILALDA
jgi:DNA-binding NtrC family response regulator